MKKILLVIFGIVLFLGGCDNKLNRKGLTIGSKFEGASANEIAHEVTREFESEGDKESIISINNKNYIVLLYNVWNIDNNLYLYFLSHYFDELKNLNRSINGTDFFINNACLIDPYIRALVNKGVIIEFAITGYDRKDKITFMLHKQRCEQYEEKIKKTN